jgi:UDP-glucose 4-epimerase
MGNCAFITGGLGLIGSVISRKLLDDNIVENVVCLDHYGRYISSIRGDFTDYRKYRLDGIEDRVIIERGEAKYPLLMSRLLAKHQPRFIFHLAALPLAKLDNLNSAEAIEGSVLSTTNIIEACSTLKETIGYTPERFVYASSSMVYGDFQCNPADEKHQTRPKEIYGTMKLAGEVITRGLGGFYGIPYTIIRPSAVFGPTDMNRRVSQIFLEKAIAGDKISVHGKDESLDFTYVEDTAKGFVLAATKEAGAGEVFNITHGKAHTLLEYVLELRKYFPDLEYEVIERDTFRPKRGTLSIDKARRLLGYEPAFSLADGVRKQVEFAKKNHPVLAGSGL